MTKKDLVADMRQYAGGAFITRKLLANYMGIKDPHNVDRYLYGLECVNGKYYFIRDVVESLKGSCCS